MNFQSLSKSIPAVVETAKSIKKSFTDVSKILTDLVKDVQTFKDTFLQENDKEKQEAEKAVEATKQREYKFDFWGILKFFITYGQSYAWDGRLKAR